MSKILIVAWREFKHTALTKTFLLAGVGMPLLLFGLIALMVGLFRPNLQPLEGTIAVVDSNGAVARAMESEFEPARIDARITRISAEITKDATPASGEAAAKAIAQAFPAIRLRVERFAADADVAELKRKVAEGIYTALVIAPEAVLEIPAIKTDLAEDAKEETASETASKSQVQFCTPQRFKPNHARVVEAALRDAVVRARAEQHGQNYDSMSALMARPTIKAVGITAQGQDAPDSRAAKMFIPMGFMMLLWITTFTGGNSLLTATIEEKSNKVMEVLLSAVSPMQLMTGKILGMAGVSAMMLIIYAGLGVGSLAALSMMGLIPPILLVYLGLYFVMAYIMVASIMAGIGSAVSDLRDAQSLITPVMILLMVPLILWLPISESPNGMLATITSFIPPLTPFVMILRVTASSEPVALWQIVATLVWGYAASIIMLWMAARVFRIGVLMYGKPPTPLELIRWLRYT